MSVFGVGAATILLGLAGYAGAIAGGRICDSVGPLRDGPPPGRPSGALLAAFAAAAGVIEGLRGAALPEILFAAMLCCALAGIWYSDVRCGIVPDAFTLAPLAFVLVFAAVAHNWATIVSAAIVFVPFACAALASHGRGMGWGDVKLVALGGALLGAEAAVLVFGVACAAAVIVALARRRRHEPLAFAPYLVGAIALPLVIGLPR